MKSRTVNAETLNLTHRLLPAVQFAPPPAGRYHNPTLVFPRRGTLVYLYIRLFYSDVCYLQRSMQLPSPRRMTFIPLISSSARPS